jgi:hypothetical protein
MAAGLYINCLVRGINLSVPGFVAVVLVGS